MTTVADVDLSAWNRYPSSPRLRGSDPFGSNLISVGQAVESNLAQSIAGGDVVAAYAPSADSRLIYVSATGNDGTGASTTIAAQTDAFDPQGTVLPYLTLAAAYAQTRANFPDWILLKRGDTWTGESLNIRSGRSASERSFITYYGSTGDRPLLKMGTGTGLNKGDIDNIAVVGLELYAHTRDPDSPDYVASAAGGSGIRLLGGGDSILINEMVIRFFKDNIIIQNFNGANHTNVELSRSIVLDSYSTDSHSQGLFISGVDGLLIEENTFDHNGWNESITGASATQFNHNLYIQSNNIGNNLIARNNIVARASSHGLMGRPGGLYEDNLLVENSISISIGYNDDALAAGAAATVLNNVALSGKRMDITGLNSGTSLAVYGIQIDSNSFDNVGTSIAIENNIVANRKESGTNLGLSILASVTYTNNAIYDWNATEDMTDVSWTHPEAGIPEYMTSIGETATLQVFLDMQRARPLNVYSANYTSLQANNYFRAGFNR